MDVTKTDMTRTGDLNHDASTTEGLPPPTSDTLVTETQPPTADPIAAEPSVAVGDLEHGDGEEGAVGGTAVEQGDGGVIRKGPSRSSSRDRKPSLKAIDTMVTKFHDLIEPLRHNLRQASKLIADSDNLELLRNIRTSIEVSMENLSSHANALVPHLKGTADCVRIREKVGEWNDKTDAILNRLNEAICAISSESPSPWSSSMVMRSRLASFKKSYILAALN